MGLVLTSEYRVNVSPNTISQIIMVMLMWGGLLEVGTNLYNFILLASPHERLKCSLFLNRFNKVEIPG
jgi:hypothetical protein